MLAFYSTKWVSRLQGYDPAKEDESSYMQRVKPQPPPELMMLLPGPRHFVEYNTTKTLDRQLRILEGKVKRETRKGDT